MLMFNITTFIAAVIRILKIHMSLIFSMNCFNVETAFIMVCRQAAGRCSCCDFESLRHTSSGMRAPQCESRGRRNPSVLVPVWDLSTREKSIQGAMQACGRGWVPLCSGFSFGFPRDYGRGIVRGALRSWLFPESETPGQCMAFPRTLAPNQKVEIKK